MRRKRPPRLRRFGRFAPFSYLAQPPLLSQEGSSSCSISILPSLKRRGGRDTKKTARSDLDGADGVVAHKACGASDHPVCAASVASRHFLIWRSHPSCLRRGVPVAHLNFGTPLLEKEGWTR